MLIEQTLEKMNAMKLSGMAEALRAAARLGRARHGSSFDERLGLLGRRRVDRPRAAQARPNGCARRSCATRPRSRTSTSSTRAASIASRCSSLGNCGFVQNRHNLVITGPTGIGKSYLACAFVERACRRGYNAGYVRLPRLLQQLAVARGDGSYAPHPRPPRRASTCSRSTTGCSRPCATPSDATWSRSIEDRSERASTLIASQLPAKDWHASIGDPNLADAICDRLLHNAHRIELKGPTIRRTKTAPKTAGRAKA